MFADMHHAYGIMCCAGMLWPPVLLVALEQYCATRACWLHWSWNASVRIPWTAVNVKRKCEIAVAQQTLEHKGQGTCSDQALATH